MAKVVNGGNKKGKVGSSIFYTIKNSNNKVTQGERIYQPNVTNPQSESQRAQRMKMKPATNFYAALSGILDHSFQGVKYGAMSRQYFLQQAIGKSQEVFPYLLKGENKFVPGPYLMSKGQLSSIGWNIKDGELVINANSTETLNPTIGNISKQLIANNAFLKEGDQITLVNIFDLEDREIRTFVPVINRFLIDSNNEADIDSVLTNLESDYFDENGLSFISSGFSELTTLAAACVIVSRKNVDGGEVWQRSTERMAVTDRVYNMYMSPDAYADALESYKRTAASYDSDYYLNDAETPEEVGGVANYSFTNGSLNFTLAGTTELHAAVLVQDDNGPVATCATYGREEDERPDGKQNWLKTYIVRGRTLVLMDTYYLAGEAPQNVTASYEGQSVQVLTPEQFVARFKDYTLA